MSQPTKDFYSKEDLTDEQISRLEYWYLSQLEDGGIPITKDNFEQLFDVFLEGVSDEEITNILNN